MDRPVREGQLYVQHQKFGKKWKKNWVVLYPASQFGVARLEFFDTKESSAQMERPNTKRLDRKIVRLAECLSILPLPTETCPKINMAAFYVETNDKSYIFAAEKQDSTEWISKLCEIAFPNTPGDPNKPSESESSSKDVNYMQMAVNSIYFSRDEVNEFWVTVQKTEAAERCGLHGPYALKAGQDGLILKDARTKQALFNWPYKLLRRYGRDKVMFSFEAGRRCDSGPGNFTFETKQGNDIFLIVESSIKEQKAQVDENRQSCPSLESDCPALMQIRNDIADSLSLGSVPLPAAELPVDPSSVDTTAPEDAATRTRPPNKMGSTEALFVRKEGKLKSLEERDAAKMLKLRVLPDPPVPPAKPVSMGTPPRSPIHKAPKCLLGSLEDPTSVYSEPKDSMSFFKTNSENLYSDPVDSVAGSAIKGAGLLRPNPVSAEAMPGPLYADLYEQVDFDMLNPPVICKGRLPKPDHIYDEPEGRSRPPAPTPTAPLGIYDEASLSQEAWKTQAINDKIGYEYPYHPKTDDYSVPMTQPLNNKPKSKPRGPKPVPAPKPQLAKLAERPRELGMPPRDGLAGKSVLGLYNFNNSNNSSTTCDAIYSRVIKAGRGVMASSPPYDNAREMSPEPSVPEQRITSIYEDLGDL
ncbi:docking protein 1 [Ambystoma mexicanum]|uniref:docking protein 1 n=1 Tax=Ambystoma mexicanum TaxID=8296 RepID=UPI0037E7CBA6